MPGFRQPRKQKQVLPVREVEVEEGADTAKRLAYGVASMQGWRDDMEDAHLALPDFDPERGHSLFAVFDGHGGAAVAHIAAERLPALLKQSPAYLAGSLDKALRESFRAIDVFLESPAGRRETLRRSGTGEGPEGMGCTAVVVILRRGNGTDKPEVVVANAGDSRIVLASGESSPKAADLSRDHTPTLPEERQRVGRAGGFVNNEGRINGNLNLSRALGDLIYKKDKRLKPSEQLISGVPEITRRVLRPTDRYLFLGCDGIWERMSSQEVVNFVLPKVGKRAARPLSAACAQFLRANLSPNPNKTQGLGCDNMTLLIVRLPDDMSPAATPAVECKAQPPATQDHSPPASAIASKQGHVGTPKSFLAKVSSRHTAKRVRRTLMKRAALKLSPSQHRLRLLIRLARRGRST